LLPIEEATEEARLPAGDGAAPEAAATTDWPLGFGVRLSIGLDFGWPFPAVR
jgi:hypothetical protein